jgi:hypothetical protein
MATRRLIRPNLSVPSEGAAETGAETQPEPQPPVQAPPPRREERYERPQERQNYGKRPYQKFGRQSYQQGGGYQRQEGRPPQGGGNGAPQQHGGPQGGHQGRHQQHRPGGGHQGGFQQRRPLDLTFAESFYYLKQMKTRTPMVFQMDGGETIKGVIEWYDRECLKVSQEDGPNIILFKRYIRYMHKDPDKAPEMGEEGPAPQDME